jgi:hypothetical protein
MRTIKTYSELIEIPAFEDRFEYAKLGGTVGEETFGGHRYLNQMLYKSRDWKTTRREVMLRDDGYDLAHEDYPIAGNVYIHHLNPITIDDILEKRDCVFDPEFLISTSLNTHNAMHYGDKDILVKGPVIRTKNDTCPWR